MKNLKLISKVLIITGMKKIVNSFIVFMVIAGLGLYFVEPSIKSYGDSIWYLFASFTTIGYGDIVAQTILGRIITIIVSIYGIFVVAFIPAVIMSYYNEFKSVKSKEYIIDYMDQLENLPNLSKEELEELSKKIKSNKYKL